jgi:hypothetical protein
VIRHAGLASRSSPSLSVSVIGAALEALAVTAVRGLLLPAPCVQATRRAAIGMVAVAAGTDEADSSAATTTVLKNISAAST